MKSKTKTHKMTSIAIFATLSFIVMLIEFPLPFFPPFLKIDFSNIIIFISGMFLGQWGMLLVTIIKNILHWLMRGAAFGVPIDQLSSMLSTMSFASVALFFYQRNEVKMDWKKALLVGLVFGSIVNTATMYLSNYFFITPFYFNIGGMALPENYFNYMLMYIPFNAIKSMILSVVIYLIMPQMQKMFEMHHNY